MKAAFSPVYGSPDIIEIRDIPTPSPGERDILVRVHAATVNRTDYGFLTGTPRFARLILGWPRPKNKTLGNEFAGEVISAGAAVTAFSPGDRVFGYDDTYFGAHATHKVIREDGPVALVPEGMSYVQAAPLTEGSHYALCNLRAAGTGPGHRVLVNGATGAIGSAAVQLAVYLGAEVTAVCGPDHLDLVRALGAREAIDYTSRDFTRLDDQFDLVFDAVGKSSFGKCRRLLKPRARYISTELGAYMQNPLLALVTPVFGGRKVLFPIPTINQADVQLLKVLAETGRFRPVTDRQYPLDEIADAYRYVGTGRKIGNVVITPLV